MGSGFSSSVNVENIVIFATTLVTIGGFLLQHSRDLHREKYLMMVSTSFQSMVTQLSAENPSEQLAGAVLCRRFFDSNSELGKPLLIPFLMRRLFNTRICNVQTCKMHILDPWCMEQKSWPGIV